MTEECGAVKHGPTDLRCSLDRGHDEPQNGLPGTWHEATLIDEREITYPGVRHLIRSTETVTWEPVDHTAEAVRHMLTARRQATPLVTATQERRPSTETGLITEDDGERDTARRMDALDEAARMEADL